MSASDDSDDSSVTSFRSSAMKGPPRPCVGAPRGAVPDRSSRTIRAAAAHDRQRRNPNLTLLRAISPWVARPCCDQETCLANRRTRELLATDRHRGLAGQADGGQGG